MYTASILYRIIWVVVFYVSYLVIATAHLSCHVDAIYKVGLVPPHYYVRYSYLYTELFIIH